jgi:hypothetical protein
VRYSGSNCQPRRRRASGRIPGPDVTGAGEGQDAPPLPGADPDDHLSRRSKAEDANPVAEARRYEGTPAEQAVAKKGNESDGIAVVQQPDPPQAPIGTS